MREQNLMGDSAIEFMRSKLNRALTQYEMDICNFPRCCIVSGKMNPPDDLKNCKQCFCVAFMPEHLESGKCKHEKWCRALRTAADDYFFEQTIGHQVIINAAVARALNCKMRTRNS